MVKKGDTWKDLIVYIKFRKEHLSDALERIPLNVAPRQRERSMQKIRGRMEELERLNMIVNGNIREYSKREWNDVNKIRNRENV